MTRFLPKPTPESAPYWEACAERRFVLQRCAVCRAWQFPPRSFCAACGSQRVAFEPASGRGAVRTYTVIRHPLSEGYAKDVPYVVALIGLEEGPTMMSRVASDAPEALAIGQPVRVDFEDWGEGRLLPVFQLAGDARR